MDAATSTDLHGPAIELRLLDSGVSTVSTQESISPDEDQYSNAGCFESMILRFLDVLEVVDGQPLDRVGASRLLARTVHMLQTCKYDKSDISAVLAMSTIHHKKLMNTMKKVSSVERSFILIAQVYISHCIVLDECCLLYHWHRHVFTTYCDMPSLNRAIEKILKRMNYDLFVCPKDISRLAEYACTDVPSNP